MDIKNRVDILYIKMYSVTIKTGKMYEYLLVFIYLLNKITEF